MAVDRRAGTYTMAGLGGLFLVALCVLGVRGAQANADFKADLITALPGAPNAAFK